MVSLVLIVSPGFPSSRITGFQCFYGFLGFPDFPGFHDYIIKSGQIL